MTWTIIGSILLFYAILILVNIPAPFEFENDSSRRLWYQPPGYVIPIVWFILFTLLGFARYTLLQTSQISLQWWLFGLAFLCATYAYYTLGLAKLTHISALWFGLSGNYSCNPFCCLCCMETSASFKNSRLTYCSCDSLDSLCQPDCIR